MIECIYVAGWLYLAGVNWNGDNYFVNIDMISHVEEKMSVSDTNNRYRTLIHTTNGIIVEDVTALDVAVAISSCDYYFMYEGEPVE